MLLQAKVKKARRLAAEDELLGCAQGEAALHSRAPLLVGQPAAISIDPNMQSIGVVEPPMKRKRSEDPG